MSAAQASRDSTRDSRGRGRARGTFQSRDSRGDGRARPSFRQPSMATTSMRPPSQPFKPDSRQNGARPRSQRGGTTPLSTSRGREGRGGSFPSSAQKPTSGSSSESWRNPLAEPNISYEKHMKDVNQTLKKKREVERREAIKAGFLADPNKPTSLANAITPVGTCQDMCPEFERVERIVQDMVDRCEKEMTESGTRVPIERIMVKKFRRSAAGYDEQLPSDIRPPLVLQKTLNYLFDEVVGGSQSLSAVHRFVWDRTRGVRNDFSIQQLTKVADLRIAIDCFERIARFHILSLHQLSRPGADNGDFDSYQEREQLNNTLLSLMYYYDDNRHKMTFPNEAEFRAYCIIFEIQDSRPDLEDRAQQWPRSVLQDKRVQTALKLYAAAGNTSDDQGPTRPQTPFLIAQANTGRFWALIKSTAVPYLMACAAEIYFGLVRRTALENIWKAYKGKRGGPTKMEDWILDDMKTALGFDDEEQTQAFCEDHGFIIAEKENGDPYVDLGSVATRYLEDKNSRKNQTFSRILVEPKKLGRTLPAVINGLSASQAQSQGLINDSAAETSSVSDAEPLFMEGPDEKQSNIGARSGTPKLKDDTNTLNLNANPFNPTSTPLQPSVPNSDPFASSSAFGKPSAFEASPPAIDLLSVFKTGTPETEKPNPFGAQQKPQFAFPPVSDMSKQTAKAKPASLSTTSFAAQQSSPFGQPSSLPAQAPAFSFGTSPLFGKVDKNEDLSSSFQETPNVPSKDLTSTPAESVFPKSKAQEPSSTTPTSSLFQFPTSSPTLFSTSTTNSSPLFASTLTPLFSPPNATSTSNEAPSTQSSSPFSKFLPPTGQPLFPTQSDSEKSKDVQFKPSAPKATTSGTSSASTTQSHSFTFPPSATAVPQTTSSQSASPFSPINTPKPPVQPRIDASTSPLLANAPRSPFTPTLPPAEQAKARPPRPDPRPTALDRIADSMVMDDEGLLSQFVEYTIGPIIAASFRQVKDERSWAKAKEVRAVLLGRKFFKRWQANAWKRCLLRKGRERRRTFARSMRELVRSTRHQPTKLTPHSQITAIAQESRYPGKEVQGQNPMPPPSVPSKKRTSLPADISAHPQRSPPSSNKKRKQNPSPTQPAQNTPNPQKISHERSHTASGLSMSHPPRKRARSPEFSRVGYSTLADGTIINEQLMKKARQLAPRVKTDTTNTDYFLLKSRGIDPSTQIVPATTKRHSTMVNEATSEANKRRNLSRLSSSNSVAHLANHQILPRVGAPQSLISSTTATTTTPKTTKPSKDDEALFASIANVRSALAESISWYQSERAKSESASKANSGSPPPPTNETEKEKKLREFKFTPSRTEKRMRASGQGHWWDRRNDEKRTSMYGSPMPEPAPTVRTGMGWNPDGNQNRACSIMSGPRAPAQNQGRSMGFAAMANGRWGGQGAMTLGADGQKVEKGMENKGGTSVEDAIEL